MAQPPNIRVPGVRGAIPPGYVLGRRSGGSGPVELIAIKDLAFSIGQQGGTGGSDAASKVFRAVGGTPGRKPLATEELFNASMKAGDSLPASLTGSLLQCETAPTVNWTITLKRNASIIGTGLILAGQLVGTWTFASLVTFSDADFFKGICPAQDATLVGVSYTLMGTRTQ